MSRQQKWLLTIYVSDLKVEKTLEVTGQTFVGNLMVELVNRLGVSRDWSDHALWWPQRRTWLLRSRVTLDVCGVQADSKLEFTPKHKNVHLELPDLQFVDTTVDFSKKVFHAVTEVCNHFGIRHPEELSFLKPPARHGDKKEKRTPRRNNKRHNSQGSVHSDNSEDVLNPSSPASTDGRLAVPGQQNRTGSLNGSTHSASTPGSPKSHRSFDSNDSEKNILSSSSAQQGVETLYKAKTLQEKVVFHSGWLDSSRSLMEQEVEEDEQLMLRFKYHSFFDLKPALDDVRINQLFEQAKWSVRAEEVDCTEEEVMTFAGLQFQVKIASSSPLVEDETKHEQDDDITSALNDLQDPTEKHFGEMGILYKYHMKLSFFIEKESLTLEGTSSPASQKTLNQMPELSDWLMLIKHKMLGMKDKKKFWCVFRDTYFSYYKSNEATMNAPIQKIDLRGCEVYPEVNVQKEKYCIKLKFPDHEELTDLELGLTSEVQYSKWMGAFRLASKGKTMADSSYESEVHGIEAFLAMQRNKDKFSSVAPGGVQIQPEDFVPPRVLKKYKAKQVAARILEAHSSLNLMTVMEAKMNYIRKWQELPDFGLTHYGVKFRGDKVSKKEEMLGIADNKITKIDASNGKILNSWRYSVMRSWNVNWETKEMIIDCEGERIRFICTSADIKSIHEFIGGYIFLSMRKDVNQPVDHELFFKLTGGSVQ